MGTYLVVGAGGIGSVVAEELAGAGHDVRLLSRRGTGPAHEHIRRIAGDATDATLVREQASGTDALFNCANPQYHRWPTDWPPIAHALLDAAAATSSGLVTLSNLYAYGQPSGPMTPHDPLDAKYEKAQVRATMWREAKAAHDAGRLRATEVRASDFVGPRAQSYLDVLMTRLLAGKSCQVLGDPDAAHSWNYTVDVARTLITCAQDDRAWGRAWHAPATATTSVRQALTDAATLASVARVKLTRIPSPLLRVAGLFNVEIRELPKTLYQFSAPFVIDDSETRSTFAISPTAWEEVLRTTIEALSPGAKNREVGDGR